MTKQITTSQLEAITWIIESTTADDLNKDEHEEFVGVDHSDEPILEVRYNYWLCGETVLRAEEYPEITYTIDWMASSGNKAGSLEEAYDFTVEFNESGGNILDLGQYVVVDDDGDEIDDAELIVHDEVVQRVAWETAAEKLLPKRPGPVDLESPGTETITVERDNDADLRFEGEQIASASSHHFEGPQNTRWTELTLYKTKGGRLVCSKTGCTRWLGERTRHSAHVVDNEAALVGVLGYGWLAKDLYVTAGIDFAEDIE
jgi:hypothetical protein